MLTFKYFCVTVVGCADVFAFWKSNLTITHNKIATNTATIRIIFTFFSHLSIAIPLPTEEKCCAFCGFLHFGIQFFMQFRNQRLFFHIAHHLPIHSE